MINCNFNHSYPTILLLWYQEGLNYGDFFIFNTVKNKILKILKEKKLKIKHIEVGCAYSYIAKQAENVDFIWFCGGGIIERWVPDVIKNFEKFHVLTKKIPYGVTGLSIGEFDYKDYFDALCYWIDNATFFYARDDFTATSLNNFSNKNNVISGVDVVFANPYLNNLQNMDDGRVGINIRELPYKDLSGEFQYKKWEQEIKKIQNIIIIPDQHDSFEKINIPSITKYSPSNVTNLLQHISYSIAMRFHVILVMGLLGKISIPIAYCPKVKRLSEQLGIGDLTLGIHDYDKLSFVVDKYLHNENAYKMIVKDNVKKLQKRAFLMFKEIAEILTRGL